MTPSVRTENLSRIQRNPTPEVVILGGGINGIGVLRDLSLNHVSAVLIENQDFCAGASGASTRLAHGGLRYLENREIHLVREALQERNLLLKIAPYATAPQRIIIPVQRISNGFLASTLRFLGLPVKGGKPNFLTLWLALSLYGLLAGRRQPLPPFRSHWGKTGLPAGVSPSVKASLRYYDGRLSWPEALAFDVLEAALRGSAEVAAINHASWSLTADGAVKLCGPDIDKYIYLFPKVIINATGGWIDVTNRALGLSTSYVNGVRGAHLVIRHAAFRKRLGDSALYFEDSCGRMVICCPLDETVLMGTTEVPGPVEDYSTIAASEVEYLCSAASSLFGDIDIRPEHVVAATTGARPLVQGQGNDPYRAPREHRIFSDTLPQTHTTVYSLAGGKWTTFRAFAQTAADLVLQELGKPRLKRTDEDGNLLGDDSAAALRTPEHLHRRYGQTGARIAAYCALEADMPLQALPSYTRREIEWLVINRAPRHLEDLVLRRTTIAIDGHAGDAALRELAEIMATVLDKPKDWIAAETARCAAHQAVRFDQAALSGA